MEGNEKCIQKFWSEYLSGRERLGDVGGCLY